MTERNCVFISHATPEDNAFSEWIAARLVSSGYSVWIDLQHDKGRPTWDDIQDVIRNSCARFVPIVSRNSIIKPGFKNEVSAAVAIARELPDAGFIIPIRLDGTSYRTEIPIEIMRLDFIDASSGWAIALEQLLQQLEKDKVPIVPRNERELFDRWRQRSDSAKASLETTPEVLISNWFRVKSLPKTLYVYGPRNLRQGWASAVECAKVPRTSNNEVLCTFSPPSDFRMELPLGINAQKLAEIPTERFLNGLGNANPYPSATDARRAMVDLIRQSFGKHVESKGLVKYQLSNRSCWFCPLPAEGPARINFDIGVLQGKRQIVGRYKTVYWHFAVSVDVTLHAPRRLTLGGHVLFSDNGTSILTDKKLAAKLRRQAMRSKQNAWWRDVLLAYVAHISGNQQAFNLACGVSGMEVQSQPMLFKSPLSISFDDAGGYEDREGPIDEDLPDDDDDENELQPGDDEGND